MAAGAWDLQQAVLASTVPAAVFGGTFRPNPFRPARPDEGPTAEQRATIRKRIARDMHGYFSAVVQKMRRKKAADKKKPPPDKPGTFQ